LVLLTGADVGCDGRLSLANQRSMFGARSPQSLGGQGVVGSASRLSSQIQTNSSRESRALSSEVAQRRVPPQRGRALQRSVKTRQEALPARTRKCVGQVLRDFADSDFDADATEWEWRMHCERRERVRVELIQ